MNLVWWGDLSVELDCAPIESANIIGIITDQIFKYRAIMRGRGAWPYLNVHLAIARFTVNRQMRCTGRPRSISVLAARPNRRIPWRSPRVQMPLKHLMRSRSVRSACLAAAFTAAAPAVLRAQSPEPLNWTAQQDHKNMTEQ